MSAGVVMLIGDFSPIVAEDLQGIDVRSGN